MSEEDQTVVFVESLSWPGDFLALVRDLPPGSSPTPERYSTQRACCLQTTNVGLAMMAGPFGTAGTVSAGEDLGRRRAEPVQASSRGRRVGRG